jgi:hypothetical protein
MPVLNHFVLHENTGNCIFVAFKTGLIEDRGQEGPFQLKKRDNYSLFIFISTMKLIVNMTT